MVKPVRAADAAVVVVALCTALPSALHGQTLRITTGTAGRISSASSPAPRFESFIAVNPRNSSNLIAVSIAIEGGRRRSIPYASFDAGQTWTRSVAADKDSALLNGGDPVVYFGPDGTAFFGTIHGGRDPFVLSRSTDGGRNWGAAIRVPGGNWDRQYLAFDGTDGPFKGRIYAAGGVWSLRSFSGRSTAAVRVVHSDDGGATWTGDDRNLIVSNDPEETVNVIADPLVTKNGRLVVPFTTISQKRSDSVSVAHFWTVTSDDGGRTFSLAHKGLPLHRGRGYRARQASTAPRATIDMSVGPYAGRIYFTWIDYVDGSYRVQVSHSTDEGESWSAPVTVNDNVSGDPSNVAIAVNKDGIVGVIFNDRRDHPENRCYRLYFAASVEGGKSFSRNVMASETPTCPADATNWATAVFSYLMQQAPESGDSAQRVIGLTGIPWRWPNGGDTQGLSADEDGVFHAAWINGPPPSGIMQLWSHRFVVAGAVAPPRSEAQLNTVRSGGSTDLTERLAIEVGDHLVDFSSHTVSLQLRLSNTSSSQINGPVSLVLRKVESSLTNMRVTNADNGLASLGAEWKMLDSNVALAPKQTSPPRRIIWSFDGGPPPEPSEALRAYFTVVRNRRQR